MVQFFRENKAVSNVVFAVSVVVLLVSCVTIGLVGYYKTANQTESDSLQNQFTTLQSNYNQLQSEYDQLQTNYNSLQSQLKSLQSSFDQLSTQYQQLLSRVPADKGIVIDSVAYNSHGVTPAGVTQVAVRNLGSSAVHVTSLKLYYGTVLASSASVLVTIPANSTVTISQFLPFTPTADIHILKIETQEGYTTTSDPLSSG